MPGLKNTNLNIDSLYSSPLLNSVTFAIPSIGRRYATTGETENQHAEAIKQRERKILYTLLGAGLGGLTGLGTYATVGGASLLPLLGVGVGGITGYNLGPRAKDIPEIPDNPSAAVTARRLAIMAGLPLASVGATLGLGSALGVRDSSYIARPAALASAVLGLSGSYLLNKYLDDQVVNKKQRKLEKSGSDSVLTRMNNISPIPVPNSEIVRDYVGNRRYLQQIDKKIHELDRARHFVYQLPSKFSAQNLLTNVNEALQASGRPVYIPERVYNPVLSRLDQADNIKNSLPPASAPKINTNTTPGHIRDPGVKVRAAYPATVSVPPQRQLVDFLTSNLPGGSTAAAYLQPVVDDAARAIKDYFITRDLASKNGNNQLADTAFKGSMGGSLSPVLRKKVAIESSRAGINR